MFDSTTQQTQHNLSGRQPGRPSVPVALVVEDHPDFRDLLSLMLRRLGYTVVDAADGEQALELASNTQPDLIVTDLGLPKVNGLELVQRLHSDRLRCPVIMLTAYDPADYSDAARKAGCDVLLSKPVDLDQFASVVSSLAPQSTARIH